MKILAYKGVSLISRLIQWQTRSPYSHIAVELRDGTVIEAWHVGGVQHNRSFRDVHTRGTAVDVFRINHEYNEDAVEQFLKAQVGKKYDFMSVARFLTRRDRPADNRWFCSELAFEKLRFLLDRIKPSHVSPGVLVLSPYLAFEKTMVV